MSLTGERLHTPLPQSPPPQNPSHSLDNSNSRSGRGPAIPQSTLLGTVQDCRNPYPALRPYDQHLAVETLILVRDPPRERLAASRSSTEHDERPASLARVAGKPDFGQRYQVHPDFSHTRTDTNTPSTVEFYADLVHYCHDQQCTTKSFFSFIPRPKGRIQFTTDSKAAKMKKRTSLQAILVPSFLQGPLSPATSPPTSPTTLTSRMRALSGATSISPSASTSTFTSAAVPDSSQPGADKRSRKRSVTFSSASARTSPPPDFLLDDDPFANLTSAPSESLKHVLSFESGPNPAWDSPLSPPTPSLPRSPLTEPVKTPLIMTSIPKASPLIASTPTSPLPRTRPAHQRPAFKSRPSLPSLDALARMNVVLTKKVRKGRVGAGLPFEPWDNLPSDDESVPSASGLLRQQTTPSTPLPPFISPPPHGPPSGKVNASVAGDDIPSPQAPALQTIAAPQPLLPSQIVALGSIAGDVEMFIPMDATPQPQPRSSALNYPQVQQPPAAEIQHEVSNEQRMSVAVSSPEEMVSNTIARDVETAPFSPVGLDDPTLSEVDKAPEEAISPIDGDEYAAYFLERYHQSSRNGSEDGHGASASTIAPAPLSVVEVLPVLYERASAEELDKEKIVTVATVEQDAVPILEEFVSYQDESYQGDDNHEELEEMSFSENQSFLDSDHPSQDEPLYMRSGSMLFSSPPSAFSLSRSLSSTSYSSCASSEYTGALEHRENEDADGVVFGSISPRKDHKYRRLVNPSLSSLELDLETGLGLDSEQGERETGKNTSRSSSGRPSLSRTRSSSDYSSDVVRSPSMEDYAFFPYRYRQSPPALEQLAASFAQQSSPATEEPAESFTNHVEQSFSIMRDSELVGAPWTNSFGEHQFGLIGGGFGFGFDKVILAAEDLEAKAEHDGVDSESLMLGTRPSVAKLAITTEAAADVQFPPFSASDDQCQPTIIAQSLVVQQATPPPTPNFSQTHFSPREMPWPSSRSSRPSSAIKTLSTHEFTDASQSQATYSGQGSSSSPAVFRGNSSSAPVSANSSRRAYASTSFRGYGGRGRGRNDEDDDDDDERRRRRALDRGYGGEMVARKEFSEDSSEDESERYTSAASSLSSRKSKSRLERMSRSHSRSPGAYVSPVSKGLNVEGYTKFPHSSSSGRHVSEEEADSEDDDVPLAHAIPGALKAQKTIRRKVREEREQRKREKLLMGAESQRDRQTTLRPAGAGSGGADLGSSSSRDAAAIAAAAVLSSATSQPQRHRTLTLPGKAPNPAALNPHDLARKLQSVQMSDSMSPTYPVYAQQNPLSPQNFVQPPPHPTQASLSHSKSFSRPSVPTYPTPPQTSSSAISPAARSRSIRQPSPAQRSTPYTSPIGANSPHLPTLRPMRSFHRPSERSPMGIDDPRSLALPVDQEQRSSKSSATSMTPTRGSHESQHQRSMSLSRRSTDRERVERAIPTEPIPALPSTIKTSHEEHRQLAKPHLERRPTLAARKSSEAERPPRTSNQLPPLPTGTDRGALAVVSLQRVFVGNLQQFHMVEIGPGTTAGDVVALMESQGILNGWAGVGGWMVFEIAQDFGMERPIRSYELLVDIQSSWLKDKTVNYFMLKLTPLASLLARSAMPTSSPTHSGYIEWESKRGKWSKRWVQLKEHSIYLSKRDNGKDAVLICSLSNFDAYHVKRATRAPKPFTFAVKSTDKLSFFENTDDYMHSFSCSEKDGKIWMEKILVARSYVLHQERQILFGAKPSGAISPSGNLALSGTRKSSSSAQRSIQPLVNMPPFSVSVALPLPHPDVFEPGSLLGRQS